MIHPILTDSQKKATAKMKSFLKDPGSKGEHFVLTGGPGTGKTYITKYVTNGFNGRIGGATISHAAKTILAENIGTNIICSTLASMLGMTMNIKDDGTFVFKENPRGRKFIERYDAIVIDEISMIDDSFYDIIMREAFNHGVKVIAIGDKYQLPPVEQDHDSKFFNQIDASLTEVVRFSGPIQELADIFKNEIENINQDNGFDKWVLNSYTERETNYDNSLKSGYTFINNVRDIVEAAAEDFRSNQDNVHHSRILAFKNASVDAINNEVRYLIYGKTPRQFEENEIIISNSNYRVPEMPSPLIHNGQILRVDSYVLEDGPRDIPCVKLKFKDFPNYSDHPIYVVSTNDNGEAMTQYKKEVNILRYAAQKNQTALNDYKNFISQFAYFDYAYAVNLYRAQGSTLENAYVFEGEVMDVKPLSWKQKFQALYVAFTRPSKNLVIYNKGF